MCPLSHLVDMPRLLGFDVALIILVAFVVVALQTVVTDIHGIPALFFFLCLFVPALTRSLLALHFAFLTS